MGLYSDYAKSVLTDAFPDRWTIDDYRIFSFGPDAGTGEVSGILDGRIAVQIGAGSYKQIRGGVVRLAGTPGEPKVDVDLLAMQEFVDGLGEGVRMLDLGERWEGELRLT